MSMVPIGKKLFDQTFGLIQRSLDLRTLRHQVLSTNITNAETSNYSAKDIPFQKVLEQSLDSRSAPSLRRTHRSHLPMDSQEGVRVEVSSEGVDIDREMARLAENNIRFQAEVQVLMKKMDALKLTIIEVK
jgi:flagellar basal-body rod protein FlgB